MAATWKMKLTNLLNEFCRLKNSGNKANLYVGCEGRHGEVFVNLQVHLGHTHAHEPAQRRGRHHRRRHSDQHLRQQEHPHDQHHRVPKKSTPSRIRRRARREQARIEAKITADKAPSLLEEKA